MPWRSGALVLATATASGCLAGLGLRRSGFLVRRRAGQTSERSGSWRARRQIDRFAPAATRTSTWLQRSPDDKSVVVVLQTIGGDCPDAGTTTARHAPKTALRAPVPASERPTASCYVRRWPLAQSETLRHAVPSIGVRRPVPRPADLRVGLQRRLGKAVTLLAPTVADIYGVPRPWMFRET